MDTHKRVAYAYTELCFFTCYAQLLRWRDSDPKKLTQELIALADAIQKWIEDAYAAIIKAFQYECMTGNTKAIHVVIKALGPHAFYEKWFNDGLKDLLFLGGKSITLRPPPKVLDFGVDYKKMYRLERRLRKTTVDKATNYNQTLRSQYYKFPTKRIVIALHYCYALLHPTLYTQAIEDLPILDADMFGKLLDIVKKNLPSR
ncbi:MAG: hypothetical protein Q8O04_03760 [Deltaproteobacteria bacterium]|nr:hypothetical protein [Deltaproteobacteria bacterium]